MGQPQALRRQNRQQIMELLLMHGTLTRPQLAERTRLSKVTVNAIVQELLEHQLVILLSGPLPGSGTPCNGRVPQSVSLHPHLSSVMGLDIQRGSVLYQQQDLLGQRERHGRLKCLPDLNACVLRLMQGNAHDRAVRGGVSGAVGTVVMGVPAPVNQAGELAEPNALPELDWAGLHGALQLNGIHVTFENDANLAALAAAQRFPEFTHLAVLLERESGTGLGLILHGELYRGALGRAGELGRTAWPQGAGNPPEVLEHLPEPRRLEATAYTLAALAQTLDLQHVVIGACPGVGSDLARRTAELLPSGISVGVEGRCAELVRDGATILAVMLGREALLQRLMHLTGGEMGVKGEAHVA